MRKKSLLRMLPLALCLLFTAQLKLLHAKAVEGVVNINTATPSELMLLPGIGKAKADQIVQLRQSKPFTSVDDLKTIKGLGSKRLEALRTHIVFNGTTTAKAIIVPKTNSSAVPSGVSPTTVSNSAPSKI